MGGLQRSGGVQVLKDGRRIGKGHLRNPLKVASL